jgi:hypothetical protein
MKRIRADHYDAMIAFLSAHKGEWIKALHIKILIGADDRECRIIKQKALKKNIVIASGDLGYNMSDDYEDYVPMIARMESQAKNMLQQAAAIRRHFGKAEQLDLFGKARV